MDVFKIGKIIKDIRNKNNLTQKEFADKYNVTYQAVSKWENGKNLPDITLLHQICNDFNINFSEIIGEYNNKKKSNKLFYIIPGVLIIVIVIILIINNNKTFEFKTIKANCKDFEVIGSLAYDSKHSSIYISNINYCGKQDNKIYEKFEYTLYEKNGNIKKEICTEEFNDANITLENYLKNISIKIDSYENSCNMYKESNLYLEIKAYFSEDMKLFEIPLSLDKTCK